MGVAGVGVRKAVGCAGGEVLFEEVAEACAGEVEVAVAGGGVLGMGFGWEGFELVVAGAFFGVAEDLVGFVDFLEGGFCGGFVSGGVRVVDSGELAEGLFDVCGGSV